LRGGLKTKDVEITGNFAVGRTCVLLSDDFRKVRGDLGGNWGGDVS